MAHMDGPYEAVVLNICDGEHGSYAVAKIEKGEHAGQTLTFTAGAPVWTEDGPPTKGDKVILEDVHERTGGFRAERARPKRLSDSKLAK
jgi:hypothetical protein